MKRSLQTPGAMKQLPADTVRLLSSSQVITSVLNVVKELMENSLDAGASSVDVKLENYGLERIEVRDNGRGIKASDAAVMALPHFTSKICSHQDLERLETYGFRGEALGSVCAVAEVAVTTRTQEDDISTQYTLDLKGSVVSQKPSHLGQGTTVSVGKLFRNLPVRRQYYSNTKKCKEELKKVQELLVAYAIIKPDLRLVLVHNKVVVWQKAKVADDRSALLAALGPAAAADLLPCHRRQEQPEIVLEGFFPKPGADHSSTSSSTPEKTFIYVNSRPVQHKEILKLLRQHYASQYADPTAGSRYPTLVLKITVPPSSVDVNLTPDKTQVLLHNKEAVLLAVEALLLSLYGLRSGADPAVEEQGGEPNGNADHSNAPPARQLSNSSSSSSVADDWIVTPLELEPHVSLSRSPADNETSTTEARKERPSAEEWSRGTALTEPESGEPLQPVALLPPRWNRRSDPAQPLGAVTEKRGALAAYDLIGHRAARAPPPPLATLLEKEELAGVLREKPAAVHHSWNNLGEEQPKKCEEKAEKQPAKLAWAQGGPRGSGGSDPRIPGRGLKRRAPLSNQQLLDRLFASPPGREPKPSEPEPSEPKPSQPLPCSVAGLRLQLQRLGSRRAAAPRGLRLVKRLASQSAWVILCGQRLMLLNPFRVEEALLFKRLLENHIVPAASLRDPIQLTDGNLGGAQFTQTLCNMQEGSPELNGDVFFSDPRLVANGFKVKLCPGPAVMLSAGRHLEVTAVADCVPFLGVEDLREILSAVLHRKARTVRECRPLKVTNYLQGEAVRLARQLPSSLSAQDVEESLRRMEQQLAETDRTCIHGRPFLQLLCELPATEQDAQALLKPLQL